MARKAGCLGQGDTPRPQGPHAYTTFRQGLDMLLEWTPRGPAWERNVLCGHRGRGVARGAGWAVPRGRAHCSVDLSCSRPLCSREPPTQAGFLLEGLAQTQRQAGLPPRPWPRLVPPSASPPRAVPLPADPRPRASPEPFVTSEDHDAAGTLTILNLTHGLAATLPHHMASSDFKEVSPLPGF